MSRFTSVQKRVFIGCFAAYALAYAGRLNLAAALPAVMAGLALTNAQAGLIQTVFAVVYAAGQFINGAVVDRVSPRRFVAAGLMASAACNLLFGLAGAYWQMLLLWALNGAAQSMLWTPVVRLLAGWFDGKQRGFVTFWISITINAGHFVAWTLSGLMARLLSWRFSFLLPSLVVAAVALLALRLLRDPPAAAGQAGAGSPSAMPVRAMVFGTGLWLALVCCVANGFVRDGVMTWAPAILAEMGTDATALTLATSLIIPLLNLLGVLLGQCMLRRSPGNARAVIASLMAAGAASAGLLALFGGDGMLTAALLLGLCCSLMYGVNPLETIVLPMDYAACGRVGLAAGMLDCFIYLGSGLASVSAGALKGAFGLTPVYALWAGAGLLGAGAALLSMAGARRLRG